MNARIPGVVLAAVIGALGLTACETSSSAGATPIVEPESSVAPEPVVAPEPAAPPVAAALLVLHETQLPSIQRLDVHTQESTLLFEATRWSYIYEFSIDRVRRDIVMAHTTAPEYGEEPFDRAGLYRIDLDAPSDVADVRACPDASTVRCFYPVVQGERTWFVQTGAGMAEGVQSMLTVADLATGEATALISNATEPTVSPDGRWLVWVAVSPDDGQRSLELGDTDGRWVRTLVAASDAFDLGQPVFAADGESVFFVRLPMASESVLAWLGGLLVSTAHAHDNHNIPGDWWRVGLDGANPTQITALQTIHYDGRTDPGGEWLFIATREGVMQVDVDTGAVIRLQATRTARALDWVGPNDRL